MTRFLAGCFIFAATIIIFAKACNAQTVVAVDINKSSLQWDWAIGTGGAVDSFVVQCGASPTALTNQTTIPDPAARSASIKSVITGPGSWFCNTLARNQFGDSPPSNTVQFNAGTAPASPTNERVVSQ